MKPRPTPSVSAWVASTPEALLYLSVLTLGEIRKGIDLLPHDDPKRHTLQGWLEADLWTRFANRILSFDREVADRWGQVEARAKQQRLTLPTVDAQLAATALHHNLTFVTRNVADVAPINVAVMNPWETAPPRRRKRP
jgi:predicted nucleic acid-binding protein